MSIEGQKFSYPGASARPPQVLQLAKEYLLAARLLRQLGRRGQPMSLAPYRLVAIHAIELHLNALLLAKGHSSPQVRGLQHNLAARTDAAIAAGLKLRQRTALHLRGLSEKREYLVARYDPDLSAMSEINRLSATLEEVVAKVALLVEQSGAKPCA